MNNFARDKTQLTGNNKPKTKIQSITQSTIQSKFHIGMRYKQVIAMI